jgi:hypothetical protein
LGHLVPGEETKESTSHEGGDEPRTTQCVGGSVSGNGRRQGNDLLPGRVDQIPPAGEDDDCGGEQGRAGAAENAVTDLLRHHCKWMALCPCGGGKKD